MLEVLAQAVNDSSANSRLLFARYQSVSASTCRVRMAKGFFTTIWDTMLQSCSNVCGVNNHCMRLLGRCSDRALSAEHEFEGTTRGKPSGDMERK